MNLWAYRARLIRVIDGDTVRMIIDHGMRMYSEQNIRVLGVDTPELFSGTDRAAGEAARDFTVRWFNKHKHESGSWPFTIATEKDKETFNRYVGTIVCVNGHDLAIDLSGFLIKK